MKKIKSNVALNSKLLFQDHASFSYILGGNRLSDKTRITVLLLFVLMLFYFAMYTVISNSSIQTCEREKSILLRTNVTNSIKVNRPGEGAGFATKANGGTMGLFEVTGVNRYNPFITFSTPLVLTTFLLTFSLGGCIGLTKHSSQTPWGALGLGAVNGSTPTLGSGSSTSGFGTPGQGGGSTGFGQWMPMSNESLGSHAD